MRDGAMMTTTTTRPTLGASFKMRERLAKLHPVADQRIAEEKATHRGGPKKQLTPQGKSLGKSAAVKSGTTPTGLLPTREQHAAAVEASKALARATLAHLAELFPCFREPVRPLKVGIAEDIIPRQPDLDVHAVSIALIAHTERPEYLAAVAEGASRIDLDGNACGTVTAQHAAHARKQEEKAKVGR
jgi:hypothetical protein